MSWSKMTGRREEAVVYMTEMRGKEMELASRLLMESLSRLWDRISSEEKILSELCGLGKKLKNPKNKFCWSKD